MSNRSNPSLPGSDALGLLQDLPDWGNVVTIVLHGGCVFEFKGPFPSGSVAEGYLNLEGPVPGFHGHLRLDAIASVGFQERPHRGRESYAFTFDDASGKNLFKVFLGREQSGEIIASQLHRFTALRDGAQLDLTKGSANV